VEAGDRREILRRLADRIGAEFAVDGCADLPGAGSSLRERGWMIGGLDPEAEALVTELRHALTRIAAALSAEVGDLSPQVVQTALDGAEFVVRQEFASGNSARVLELMPSFVFLVTVSTVDRDRAFDLSRRTADLIAEMEEEPKAP
jgi:hypothetical protein